MPTRSLTPYSSKPKRCAQTIASGFVRVEGPSGIATFAHGRAVFRAFSARLGRTVRASALVRCASEYTSGVKEWTHPTTSTES